MTNASQVNRQYLTDNQQTVSEKPICCTLCSEPRFRRGWCIKHSRFANMRDNSRAKGQYIPSWDELELMFADHGMRCPHCKEPTVMTRRENPRRVMSLTHNDDGSVIFLCLACSITRVHHRDEMYNFPEGVTYIGGVACDRSLPPEAKIHLWGVIQSATGRWKEYRDKYPDRVARYLETTRERRLAWQAEYTRKNRVRINERRAAARRERKAKNA